VAVSDTETLPDTHETTLPLDRERVRKIMDRQRVDVRTASIREMNGLVNTIEAECDVRFIRMEFGIPGLPAPKLAIEAEHHALSELNVGHVYAPFAGIPELKQEAACFAELFMGLELPASSCVPTVGAMEGCFASILLASRLRKRSRTLICLDPGFPVNRLQLRLLGLEAASIDLYDHRGDKLLRAIEERASRGDVCGVIWSSPNNPSWVVLKERELEGIGRICDENSLLAIEDLAYFGMDTREDYLTPGAPPFQPTVLRYTKRGISLVSSSKIFSYAGQRVALAFLSPELMEMDAPELEEPCGTANVGHAFLHAGLYPVTASVPQSTQHGLLALLRAANSGNRDVFRPAFEYARRARIMKPMFLDKGFKLVYDNDLGEPLADGFYFTVSYPGFDHGADLIRELLLYGISAITLESAGSSRVDGLRACVSLTDDSRFEDLRRRLQAFHTDHPV
jgi:aspartate/methionine/tyrosine aminotransferase